MPKITSINIKNLRGLEDVTLEDTRMFNLIVGPSEIGKTTVLEGIFMSSSLNYIQGLIHVNNFRGADLSRVEYTRSAANSMFRNMANQAIEINTSLEAENTRYARQTIFNKASDDGTSVAMLNNKQGGHSSNNALDKIQARIQISGDLSGEITGEMLIVEDGRIDFNLSPYNISKNSGEALSNAQAAEFFPASTMQTIYQVFPQIENIILNKKKPDVLPVLQKINPSIADFGIAGNQLYIDIGLETMAGMHVAGSGVREILITLSCVSKPETGIVLVDEIGRGIYYASLYSYLRALLRFLKKQGKQIFATTHSKDVLIALQAIAASEDLREDVMCYVMARDVDGLVYAHPYSYGTLEHCIEHAIEVR